MKKESPSGPVRRALRNTCPNCGKGALFTSWLRMAPICTSCQFDLSELDAGDGPASFLVLIYGAIVVPREHALDIIEKARTKASIESEARALLLDGGYLRDVWEKYRVL